MIYCDTRLGGVKPTYHGIKPAGFDMPLSPVVKNSVCFLCGKNRDGSYYYGGTGFFVSVPSETDPNSFLVYLVTAKHNIDKAKDAGYFTLSYRANTQDGDVDFFDLSDGWKYTEDEIADVAVMPIYDVPAHFQLALLKREMLLTDPMIEEFGIGLADQLITVGLFQKRYGRNRNIPIVRSGIIAAMAEEPIQDVDTGAFYDAYLAEIRSIGGLSGSPVLVLRDEIARPESPTRTPITGKVAYLLGLIRAHWNVTDEEALADFSDSERDHLNTGIAIVTPIKEALRIIDGDELMKDRKRIDKLRAQKDAPTLDSGFKEADNNKPFTANSFEDALKKASRKTSEPESENKTRRKP